MLVLYSFKIQTNWKGSWQSMIKNKNKKDKCKREKRKELHLLEEKSKTSLYEHLPELHIL